MINKLLAEAIADWVNQFLNYISFNSWLYMAFFIETSISTTANFALDKFMAFFQLSGIFFISIKFALKGLNTYVLYTEGDPDISPFMLLLRFVKAIILALSGMSIYNLVMTRFISFIQQAQNEMFTSFTHVQDFSSFLTGANMIMRVILGLVWLIAAALLYFDFMKRGIEMMVLRVGFPWACAGIINADEAGYKNYLNKFFQNAVTVMVQYLLFSLAVQLLVSNHILLSIFTISIARSTPRFLQEFMIVSGGGTAGNKAYYVSQMASSVVRMIRRGK